jgi:chromosome segregation ATPase
MAQRILVLEKDTNFLRELESGFSRYGAAVEVVQDGDASVARAKAQPTALVLLSADAMNAPGEAFLVCKRFKSDDDLSKIPFVIMGGSQHAESFESHKKLKRRADEYVKLPMGFDELVTKLTPLVPLEREASNDGDGMDVDADIDAFADNAFDDLLQEEPKKVSEPPKPAAKAAAAPAAPVAPAAPSAPAINNAAQEQELARLKAQLDQLTARAEGAEKRADTAEKRAEAAEKRPLPTSRASVAPPGAGVSSRDYLEMREQLNRKDKEILGLRDEVTTRDRQLLDASDKSLELERAQANLHDELAASQRQLDEAQGKIKAYETDREAVAKRLEDLKGRLGRAEEKGKKLEDELDTARTQHASESAEVKAAHDKKVSDLENNAASEMARLRAANAMQVSDLETKHANALSSAESKAHDDLAKAESKAREDLASAENRAREELASERSARENEVSALHATHQRATDELKSQHARVLSDQREAAETAHAQAVAEGLAEKTRALEEAANQHASELARKLSDAELAKNAALDGLRKELEARQAAALKETEDKHGKELAILGRKLSEAESKGSLLEERLEETEQAKQELESNLRGKIAALESDLSTRTDERDRAQNELSAARASIASHERTEAQQTARIVELEGALGSSEGRVQRQSAKLASDAELLERVRKALGISIGLLEQQKETALEE